MFGKKKITTVYTIEKCKSCHKEVKRKFSDGDVLFQETAKCASCDGILSIERIFGETIEQ